MSLAPPSSAGEFCDFCRQINIADATTIGRNYRHLGVEELEGRDCPCCQLILNSSSDSKTKDGYHLERMYDSA